MASPNMSSKPEDEGTKTPCYLINRCNSNTCWSPVTVTLLVRNTIGGTYSAGFPERQFILTRHAPSIAIGRASKVPSKGFVAAHDNAWFDSPVMSRQHAELVASFDSVPKTVFLKDIGSLHGTFYTAKDASKTRARLEKDQAVKLATGDVLQFGIDIFRSKETFPPCAVDFIMEESKHNLNTAVPSLDQPSNRVFTVPDGDIDDDEDADVVSDNDSVMETEKPSPRQTDDYRGQSIDLTEEPVGSSDNNELPSTKGTRTTISPDFIDLTSEPDAEDPDPKPNVMEPDHTVNTTPPRGLTESGVSAASPGSRGNSKRPSLRRSIVFDFGSRHSSCQEDPYPRRFSSEDTQLSESDNESLLTRDSADDMSDTENDAEDEPASPSLLFRDWSISEGSEDDDGLLDHLDLYDDIPYYDEDEDDYSEDSASSSSREEIEGRISRTGSPIPDTPLCSSPILHENIIEVPINQQPSIPVSNVVGPFITDACPVTTTAQAREPSPSDAALIKSRRPVTFPSPDYSRAQALGEKTGKHEYFAARESNRRIMDDNASLPISAIRETLNSKFEGQITEDSVGPTQLQPSMQTFPVAQPVLVSGGLTGATKVVPEASFHPQDTASDNVKTSADAHDSAWSASGERFINNPRTEDLPLISTERPHSPELDMTSAYTFQQSKMASEAKANKNLRRLPIKDLLAQEPKLNQVDDIAAKRLPPIVMAAPTSISTNLSGPAGSKRSFEDAFVNQAEQVDQIDPTNKSHDAISERSSSAPPRKRVPDAATPRNLPSPVPTRIVPVEPAQGERQPVAIPMQPDNNRPSKRRCLAQAAAYVAVGGAAVFTFMVSTAPSF
ncbi:hypothetical protein F4779DRAFT_39897 [Xylariaceae sp. FL0662B]|nr:hypothetical protein F4779DRAFT_39897 [Xylariaceae sp. FL0662B]